jgi:dephospho-CoA kinase
MPAIVQAFGVDVLAADGALDRDVMRQRVFGQAQARARLEAIIHPRVAEESSRQALEAERAGARCVVFDVPLLVESERWRPRVDAVMVVDCTPQRQIGRVMQRSGWSQEAVEKVISNQASRARRLAAADVCIYNETLSLEELDALVGQTWKYFGL